MEDQVPGGQSTQSEADVAPRLGFAVPSEQAVQVGPSLQDPRGQTQVPLVPMTSPSSHAAEARMQLAAAELPAGERYPNGHGVQPEAEVRAAVGLWYASASQVVQM